MSKSSHGKAFICKIIINIVFQRIHVPKKENLIILKFSDNYKYVYNGGCASATQSYPSKLKSKKVESVDSCYELCRDTENCAYFEYDSSANKLCHLHSTGITRGNPYPSVKCYKMEGELNQ